jgi:hypothetical protein
MITRPVDSSSIPSEPPWRVILQSALFPFLLASILFLLCRTITTTLPLYFCAFAILSFILPAEAISQTTLFRQSLCAAAPVDAIALLLLPPLFSGTILPTQWLLFYALLIAYAAALWGCVRLLASLRFAPPLAAAMTLLFSIAWLTWPLWTSAFVTAPITDMLIPPHPIFATNSLLHPPFGVWTESPFPYRLTTLNQDIPYSLPATIIPSLVCHALFAVITLTAASLRCSRHQPSAPPLANQ